MSYTYDLTGRLLTETDALGTSTKYTYDPAGRISSLTDANGAATTYSWNGFKDWIMGS